MEIREDDKHKTVFQVGALGFYEFNRMPFGLCHLDMNLRDCLIYLDDVIIFSTTFEDHLDRLEAVFTRLEENNLKQKASNCDFFKSQVTYLENLVSDLAFRLIRKS